MSGQIDPITNPQAWDYVIIGGITSPLCEVGEFKRNHEWDVKKGKGTLGATITFVGRPPAKGSITFKLFQTLDFALWDKIRAALKYDPTKKNVSAVDIYHPSLVDIDIASVVTENIGNIVHKGEGLYEVKIDLLEFFPPPNQPAVSTANGATQNISGTASGAAFGGTAGAQPPSAGDQQQQQVNNLLQQAAAP